MKLKITKKRFVHFESDYKKNRPKKNWVDKVTEIAGKFEKVCKAEGIKTYSTMSETIAASTTRSLENYFTVTWKIMFTSTSTNCLLSSQPWISGKNARWTWYQRKNRNPTFCPFCTAGTLCVQKWTQSSHVEVGLTFQEGLWATVHTGKFWNCCNFFQKTSCTRNKRWTGWDYPR